MPYSITTKDGITINNIPDDIAPDAQVLRDRVAQERAKLSGEQPTAEQPIAVGVSPLQRRDELVKELSIVQPMGDMAKIQPLVDELSAIEAQTGGGVEAVVEPLLTVGSSAITEPIAGVAGIAQAINPIADKGAGAEAVEATREALTFKPRTQTGQAGLQAVGETLKPVGEALQATERFLGEETLEITGSPALAAAAATIPTAVLEAVGGLAAFKQSAKTGGRLKGVGKEALDVTEKQVKRALVEAAPDVEVIKNTSRAIYKEIDDLGVKVKPKAFERFVKRVTDRASKERVNKNLSPAAFGAAQEFRKELKNIDGKSITDLDDLRVIAQDAASSAVPADARIGLTMLDEIDGFLDNVGSDAFIGAKAGEAAGIGKKYTAARKLWGRARRAELIEEAIGKAELQASGFENGMRTQLRQIVSNKKRSRFFTKEELDAMRDVIKGTNEQNILKLVGRLGFSEGQATTALNALASSAVLGPTSTLVGQFSKKLAQRATARELKITDAIIKAGTDGRKITEAYLKTTPKAQRSSEVLADLLLNRGVEVDNLLLSANKATREAAEIAKGRRAFAQGASAGGAIAAQQERQ